MPWIHEYRALRIFTWNEVIHSLFGTCLVPFPSTLPASSFHFNIFRVTQFSPRLIHVEFPWIDLQQKFNIHPSQKDIEAISTEKEYLWRIAVGRWCEFQKGWPFNIPYHAGHIWGDDVPFPVWWWDMFFFLKNMSQVHTFILQIWSSLWFLEWLEGHVWSIQSKNDPAKSEIRIWKANKFWNPLWECPVALDQPGMLHFFERFCSQECARGLQFALQPDWSKPKWKELKEMDEGCTNFTGSPPKVHMISS